MPANRSRVNTLKVNGNVKLNPKPSFAMRLGAFILEGVKKPITFSKESGFSNENPEVFGVLPLLHMNIKESTFKNMLNNASGNLHTVLKSACSKKGLNKKLVKVDFNCNEQTNYAVSTINKAIIDSINNRYEIRQNGQKRLGEILRVQTWQYENRKIPKTSLNYNN